MIVLGMFMKNFKMKCPDMLKCECFFQLGQRTCSHRCCCQELDGLQIDSGAAPPPYSPDLVPADFLLFREVKEELSGLQLSQKSLKNAWEAVIRGVLCITFTGLIICFYIFRPFLNCFEADNSYLTGAIF
jgi:hypothetical protein